MVGGYHYLVSPFGINWFDDTSQGQPKSEHTQLTQSFEVDRIGLWNPKNRANAKFVVASGEIPKVKMSKGRSQITEQNWNTHVENNGASASIGK